ncbi:phosphate signaling complex protein PhoU [Pontibacter liquoris]|uniref:phosphate signaling complex protein PhoU n=1 Tax=Pontibacter liquoris TaxID=2905677 RepID=UPI001FA806E2|nr:phosphate signaling complex protein PhoU [Pontibacter liquoris]
MPQIDTELEHLKVKLMEMWDLVEYQMQSGREALLNKDQELANKIIKLGKKVNQYDVKIDRQCENFFALFTPVAVDLRIVLAILKINANIERIGDTAEGIAMHVERLKAPLNQELVQQTNILTMYDEALKMLADCRIAFMKNDTEFAKQIIKRDKLLNKINRQADAIIAKYLRSNIENIEEGLIVLSIIKKLERVGDQVTNIAEEIIFYQDAKVVKHKTKDKKKKKGE